MDRQVGRRAARLAIGVLAAVGVAAGCYGSATSIASAPPRPVESPQKGTGEFPNTLKVPPLLSPRIDGEGRKVFDLTMQTGTSTFLPGTTTATWGVNGSYLGPTLRASRGDRVLINVHNTLPETTTIHWHGMHLPAADDGGPHQMITSGATWAPSWRIDQPAATLWYHPHPHGETADQTYRGVAGLFLLDDAHADALPLPQRYGVDDIPLVIQDKRLNADGSLDFNDGSVGVGPRAFHRGRLGDTILVNGTTKPYVSVADRRVRFRLLNASDSRVYDIGFTDGRGFDVIATDQGLLEHPVWLQRVQLSPGERAEIVATFAAADNAVLRSFPPDVGLDRLGNGGGGLNGGGSGGGGADLVSDLNGATDTFDLLQVRAATTLRSAPAVPARLAALPALDPTAATQTRRFTLDRTESINGRQMDMNRIDFAVKTASTEIWEIRGQLPHNFHIHGVSFKVIDENGQPPPPQLAGAKDTVFVPPVTTVHLLVHFGNYADPHHPYMYHCHMLQHEDTGMMGQFVVVDH